ncbi:hypothetical protein ACVME8_010102 [Bradyrhizobium diazoefficiens]
MNGSRTKLIVPLLAAAALAMTAGMAQAQQKKTVALVTNVAAERRRSTRTTISN